MSAPVVPHSFLFRYAIRCERVPRMPTSGEHIARLGKECEIPFFSAMDSASPFAKVWLGWNENGLGVAFEVRDKQLAAHSDPQRPTGSDGMSFWLDTRDTRTIHRATRYCQRFLFLAHDGSDDALPKAMAKSIKRAQEEPPTIDETQIRIVRFAIDEDGDVRASSRQPVKSYRIEVFLPSSILAGFDPENNRRLGFFYRVRDQEMGDQILSGARELPYWEDPSLWATLVLEN